MRSRLLISRLWALLWFAQLAFLAGCGGSSEGGNVVSIEVTPPTVALSVGDSATLTATAYGENGETISGVGFGWESSNPAVATVNGGTVTAVAAGLASISASSGGVVGASSVEVFDGEVRFNLEVVVPGGGGMVSSSPAGIDCPGTCMVPFTVGAQVTLSATANGDHTFVGWSGSCSGPGDCVVTMDAPRTVTATFEPLVNSETMEVTVVGDGSVVSDPPGIDCPGTCSAAFAQDTELTLIPTPGADQQFLGWSQDCSGTGECVSTMNGPRAVTATFVPQDPVETMVVTVVGEGSVVSDPPGIDCPGACTADFLLDSEVTLTPTPGAGQQFMGWSEDCSGTGECVSTMNGPRSVTATFEPVETMEVTVVGDGSVVSGPSGIDCPGTCTADFVQGTEVTLIATPGMGQQFSGWSGDCSGMGACVLTMAGPRAATATFEPLLNPQTLDVAKVGSGTVTSDPAGIDCGATCSADFPENSSVTLTATPDAGWLFDQWNNDCSGSGGCTVTMTADRFVQAAFEGPFDFSVAADVPTNHVFLVPGESVNVEVSVSLVRGAPLPVDLSLTGLPPDVVATFDPPAVAPDGTATLTLTAGPGAALYSGQLTLAGQSGIEIREDWFNIMLVSQYKVVYPTDVAIEAGGATALVVDSPSPSLGRLLRIDADTREIQKTITSNLIEPNGLALEAGGGSVLVSHRSGLARVELDTGEVTTLATDLFEPRDVAVEGGGTTALVTDCGLVDCGTTGRLVRVELSNGQVSDVTSPAMGLIVPDGIAIEPGGAMALVVESGAGQLLRVDLASGATGILASGFYFGGTGGEVAIESGGDTALIPDQGAGDFVLYRVDLATGRRSSLASFGPCCNGPAPMGIAIEPGDQTALVAQWGNDRIIRVDLTRPEEELAPARQSIERLFEPIGVAIEAGGATALVTDCGPSDCGTSGRLVRVDLAAGLITAVTPVALGLSFPAGVALEPAGDTALVMENGIGNLIRVDLANGGVQVVATGFSGTSNGVDLVVESGGATALVVNRQPLSFSLNRVDLTTGVKTVIADLGACCEGPGHHGIAVLPDGSAAIVAASSLGLLQHVDLSSGAVTTLVSGLQNPMGVEAEASGLSVLVTERSAQDLSKGRLIRVDLATGLRTVLVPALFRPYYMEIESGQTSVLVVENNRLLRLGLSGSLPSQAVHQDLDIPTGIALEAGGTILALACQVGVAGWECSSTGELVRIDPVSGSETVIVAGLNYPKGLALESGGSTALVTDCGPAGTNNCNADGRLLRVDLAGSISSVAQGLSVPTGVWIEDGGATALVTEKNAGRLLRINVQSGMFSILASGMNNPKQVQAEPGGVTALVGVDEGLARVDLASGDWSVLTRFNLAGLAIEPGGTTALLAGNNVGLHASLVRVNLVTGALDILVSGLFDDADTLVLDAGGTFGYVSEYRWISGSLMTFAVP